MRPPEHGTRGGKSHHCSPERPKENKDELRCLEDVNWLWCRSMNVLRKALGKGEERFGKELDEASDS